MPLRILLVDDSEYMRRRIATALDEEEYQIVGEAPDGVEAVKEYKRNADGIDVILMDIVMARANGIKATAALKQIDPAVRIVMCTSVGQRKKMKLAARAGADGYLIKPFADSDIVDAIESVIA
jgi:two-component system chemotaxis response regulator CheY